MSRSGDSSLPSMDVAYLHNGGYQPLSELMRAIVLRTVEDYHSGGEFRDEAIQYMHDEDEEYIFSFYSICGHVGLDPVKTREKIIGATHKISTRRRAA